MKMVPETGPEHKMAAVCLETRKMGAEKEVSETILPSFSCVFASVNLEIVLCRGNFRILKMFGSLKVPIKIGTPFMFVVMLLLLLFNFGATTI